ncbi:probable transcription repressor OFP9 [Impatiens glandulifera]|uniref:probable transcription repressor OFP9 n=1 Tax=Impatiens glandulifera TaxID=253017 RepID=UPI001FB180D1|nr:probable transcription repressor OFP9 [Impatiens glandulifera]
MELLKKQKLPPTRCRSSPSSITSSFCCNCRLSDSSPEHHSSNISSLAHAMVQERLDQIIRETQLEAMTSEERRRKTRRRSNSVDHINSRRQFIVMVAMEKSSHDPRQDFRESMTEMISANRIYQPKHLRQLLNCFLSMNSSDFRGIILQVFHEVCYDVFLSTSVFMCMEAFGSLGVNQDHRAREMVGHLVDDHWKVGEIGEALSRKLTS